MGVRWIRGLGGEERRGEVRRLDRGNERGTYPHPLVVLFSVGSPRVAMPLEEVSVSSGPS